MLCFAQRSRSNRHSLADKQACRLGLVRLSAPTLRGRRVNESLRASKKGHLSVSFFTGGEGEIFALAKLVCTVATKASAALIYSVGTSQVAATPHARCFVPRTRSRSSLSCRQAGARVRISNLKPAKKDTLRCPFLLAEKERFELSRRLPDLRP